MQSIQEQFLESLIKNLIEAQKDKNRMYLFDKDPYIQQSNQIKIAQPVRIPLPSPIQKPITSIIRPPFNSQIVRKPIANYNNPQPSMLPQQNYSQQITSSNITGLKKVIPFLENPSIRGIECSGPDKPLLINKQGIVESIPIMLSNEEINSIIKEISQKTRIPLLPGLFKAIFGNHILTAVISEFVGSRFIIERRR